MIFYRDVIITNWIWILSLDFSYEIICVDGSLRIIISFFFFLFSFPPHPIEEKRTSEIARVVQLIGKIGYATSNLGVKTKKRKIKNRSYEKKKKGMKFYVVPYVCTYVYTYVHLHTFNGERRKLTEVNFPVL